MELQELLRSVPLLLQCIDTSWSHTAIYVRDKLRIEANTAQRRSRGPDLEMRVIEGLDQFWERPVQVGCSAAQLVRTAG